MKTYHGSCHCGKVRYAVRTDLTKVVECNCSLCRKRATLHHRVAPDQFTLISGKEALSLYRFGTMTAKHFFCATCGIHVFSNPRAAPHMISVNARSLDDFDVADTTVIPFDGKNWEQAVAALNRELDARKD